MQNTSKQVDLIINRLKRSQFSQLQLSGEVLPDQLYCITDDATTESVVQNALATFVKSDDFKTNVSAVVDDYGITYTNINEIKQDLYIYTLTKAQYEQMRAQGQIVAGRFYYITDDDPVETIVSNIISTAVGNNFVKLSSDIQQKVSSDIEIDGFVSIGSLSVGSQATEPFQRLKELMQQKLSRLDPETASTYDIVSALQSIYLGGSI